MEEGKKFRSVTDYLNMLNMVYYIDVAVPLVIFLVIYLGNKDNLSINGFLQPEALFVKGLIAVLLLAVIIGGEVTYKRKLSRDFSQLLLQSKLHIYFQASFIRYAAYLVGSLIAIAGLFGYMEGFFVAMYMVILFAVSMLRPTKKKIIGVGIFNEQEISALKKEDIIP